MHTSSSYEIRDFDLPDRHPRAYADDLETAKATVEQLHSAFFDQLEANGEGCAGAMHTLSITSCPDGRLLYISGVGGCRA